MGQTLLPVKKFTLLWVHSLRLPELDAEHAFHPKRKWRFDFAHVPTKVAIEIEGGVGWFMKGAAKGARGHHITPEGYANDCEKYNEAQRLGWRVFRLTSKMITEDELARIAAFIRQQPHVN